MADLKEEAREDITELFNIECPNGFGNLSPAPNDKMPNPDDWDFHCNGVLYNMRDVLAEVEDDMIEKRY